MPADTIYNQDVLSCYPLGIQNRNFVYVSMRNTYLLKDPVPKYLLVCGFVEPFHLLTGYGSWEFLIFQLFSATITTGNMHVGGWGFWLVVFLCNFFKWKLRFLLSDMTEKTGVKQQNTTEKKNKIHDKIPRASYTDSIEMNDKKSLT